MSLKSGASSGPCVWPVSATRSGMYSSAPLRPVRSFKSLREQLAARAPESLQSRRGGGENCGPAAATTRCSSAPSGGNSPRTTASHGAASAGSTTLWRTSSTNAAESAQPEPSPISAADMRCKRLLLPVHQLRLLETRRRAAEMFGPEMRGHVGGREPAVDIGGVPQAEQVIEQRRRQESALAKLLHAGAAVPLGQRRAVGAHQQADMAVAGPPHAERIEQHQLARRIGEMIVAAQHVRDAHHRIIDGIAKKERRRCRPRAG